MQINLQDKYNEILQFYRRGFGIQKTFFDSNHSVIASSLGSLGNDLNDQRNCVQVLDYYKWTLKVLKDSLL